VRANWGPHFRPHTAAVTIFCQVEVSCQNVPISRAGGRADWHDPEIAAKWLRRLARVTTRSATPPAPPRDASGGCLTGSAAGPKSLRRGGGTLSPRNPDRVSDAGWPRQMSCVSGRGPSAAETSR
jgi:hypothetical protein